MIDSPLVKKRRPRTKCLHLTFSDTWQVYFEPRNAHQRVGCKETPCLPFLTVGKWRAFQMAMHACIACAWRWWGERQRHVGRHQILISPPRPAKCSPPESNQPSRIYTHPPPPIWPPTIYSPKFLLLASYPAQLKCSSPL